MKKTLAALALIVGLSLVSARAQAAPAAPPTYVAVATFTATSNAKVFAFQNTSSSLDVYIKRIEIANVHDESAITGGQVFFNVYASTQVTHGGTGRVRSFSMAGANVAQPAYITVSTGPVNVQLENLSGNSTHPLFRPLSINTDETATAPNLVDAYESREGSGDVSPIKLPAGANRAIVVEQRQMGGTAMDTGKIRISVEYWAR